MVFGGKVWNTHKEPLPNINVTSTEFVSEFRKYSGEGTYNGSVMFDIFYSLALQ